MDINRRKFEELLPFYVNQTLALADIKFIEEYVKQNPDLQAQVKFMEVLSSAVKDEKTPYPSSEGWSKLLARFHAYHAKPNISSRLKDLFNQWGFSPAFGIVLGLLVAQSTLMLQLGVFTSGAAYRGLTTQSEFTPHLKITINPSTDYAQLVDLLRKNGCRVVSGPSETGELWIHVEEPEKLNIIKLDLINSGLVDEALLLTTGKDH